MTSKCAAFCTTLLPLFFTASMFSMNPSPAEAEPNTLPCTGQPLDQGKTALQNAQQMVDDAIATLDNPTDADLSRLRIWFGATDASTIQLIRQTLTNTRAFIPGANLECAVQTDMKLGDVYAYVHAGSSFTIVLGSFFYSAPETGYDSQPGVMIHEMSHFLLTGSTTDSAYGVQDARSLAATNPSAAKKNADNYEYFVESNEFGLS